MVIVHYLSVFIKFKTHVAVESDFVQPMEPAGQYLQIEANDAHDRKGRIVLVVIIVLGLVVTGSI